MAFWLGEEVSLVIRTNLVLAGFGKRYIWEHQPDVGELRFWRRRVTTPTSHSLAGFIGRKVFSRRTELNLTQELIAERLGLQVSEVAQIETGHRHPSVEELYNLCSLLNVPPSWFFEGATSALKSVQSGDEQDWPELTTWPRTVN